jgi:hypothetical protein
MNKKHYLIYWDKKILVFHTTTPRDRARENPGKVPDEARTQAIEDYLKNEYGFVEFTYAEVVVLCNFDTLRRDF